jgi:hypothetical protein
MATNRLDFGPDPLSFRLHKMRVLRRAAETHERRERDCLLRNDPLGAGYERESAESYWNQYNSMARTLELEQDENWYQKHFGRGGE